QYGHDEPKAAILLKTWIDEHPNDGRALFQYGSTLKNLKRYTEAETALKKAVSLQPENAYAKSDLIAVYYALNKEDEALKLFDLASKAGQVNRNVYANIAFSLFVLNKHQEGVQYFEKILPAERMPWDYYNLGCGYARLNNKKKAFEALNKAAEMGYHSKQQYENDDDLNSLRSDKAYQELMAKLK
ncbi:MAG: hypothetical protein C0490_12990, partial [Marivirga sp.]|nr:hypothetical protein [Marivirga sp.]